MSLILKNKVGAVKCGGELFTEMKQARGENRAPVRYPSAQSLSSI